NRRRAGEILLVMIAVAVVASLFIFLYSKSVGFAGVAAALVIVTASVYPHVLVGSSDDKHVDIAGSAPFLATYTLVLALLLLALPFAARGGNVGFWLWVPFIGWLIIGMCSFWSSSSEHWAGILQLALAPAAWFIGAYSGKQVARLPRLGSHIIGIVGFVFSVQLVVCMMQAVGIRINPLAADQQAILGDRYNGTLAHPDDLGKVIFFLIVLLLPLLNHASKRTLRLGACVIAIGIGVLVLTGGRAVLVSALVAIAVYALVMPTNAGRLGPRLTILAGVGAATLFASGVLIERFSEDPEGGARNSLTQLALGQIAQRFWTGTGPNSYVTVVGQLDALTASGVPVHNAVLLAAGELGVPGAALLLLPFVLTLWLALKRSRRIGYAGDFARAIIAMTPGLCLAGATGWGLLGSYVLPVFTFVVAFLYGGLISGKKSSHVDGADPLSSLRGSNAGSDSRDTLELGQRLSQIVSAEQRTKKVGKVQ
ncbi:MAG: hypothetical protein JWP75_1563, partial [Frondihabitans sp.]|nr:hypothetical protein [Frondihabitans sp.]